MGRLNVFNFLTMNGFYKGEHEDISWHRHGDEEGQYAAESVGANPGILVFGRVTHDMMKSYWPTPVAMQNAPAVATGMNNAEKIVFSRSLTKSDWNNTTVVNGDIAGEIRRLKKSTSKHLTILGSGSIVTQLSDSELIDSYQFMIDPVVLGSGTPVFNNLRNKLDLKLTNSRVFSTGTVLLTYERF